jgi:nodulation protein E
MELIATMMTIREGLVPPTVNYLGPDPACDLDCVPDAAREMRVDAALSNSFAFGGLNAVLAVKRFQ